MSKKLNKLIAITAITGAAIATAATLFTKSKFYKKNTNPSDNSEEDFDDINFADICNDTPRNYVSIQINERNSSDDADSPASKQSTNADSKSNANQIDNAKL
jgi:hypothetical protein